MLVAPELGAEAEVLAGSLPVCILAVVFYSGCSRQREPSQEWVTCHIMGCSTSLRLNTLKNSSQITPAGAGLVLPLLSGSSIASPMVIM